MGSPSRNVQYHPPRLSEDRLNLPPASQSIFAYTLLREIGNAPGPSEDREPDRQAGHNPPERLARLNGIDGNDELYNGTCVDPVAARVQRLAVV